MARKTRLVSNVQQAVDEYERAFVFSFENMRSAPFKVLRDDLGDDARFFLGSNKVMQLALGREAGSAYRPNLHRLASMLVGQVGLLFTNKTDAEMKKFFETYGELDFARSGALATQSIVVPAGPLAIKLQHTMVPQLRKLGLPCELNRGIISVRSETTVCKEGDTLTAEAAQLAKLLDVKMAWFNLTLVASWSREAETFKVEQPDLVALAAAAASS
jgi:mRNA turnover protein 4